MSGEAWSLETVRGREPGRLYPLGRGETVIGNALNGEPGLDLAHQEGDSPRKMAPRQAQLELLPQGLTVRDLESPGGTFVNRQRLLPGQTRTLQAGDVLQLGGVQLKVVAGVPAKLAGLAPVGARAASAPTPAAAAKPATAARGAGEVPPASRPVSAPAAPVAIGPLVGVFTLASGARCRSWDDFLTVSAQRWEAMRDELVSGRLAAFFASAGRREMAPSPGAPGTPDERLDAWLGGLPTSRPSRPELDVNPAVLKLRAVPGGGIMRASLEIRNTGYRLLRTQVRIEPAGVPWLRLPAALGRGPIVTVEQTELPIEVHIPETFEGTPTATLVLESNGGGRRVEVRLERPAPVDLIPEAAPGGDQTVGLGLREIITGQSLGRRLVLWTLAAALMRGLVVLSAALIAAGPGEGRPPLRPAALVLAAVGVVAAIRFVLKHGEPRDLPAVAFAAGVAGVLAAAPVVAACRTIEPLLGPSLAGSPVAVCLVWGALGAGLAAVSVVLIPAQAQPAREGSE